MNASKGAYALVSIFIAVLIIATVAVPVVDDAQRSNSTVYNNGTTQNYHASLDQQFELTKAAGSTTVIVNGVEYSPKSASNYLLMTDKVSIVHASSGSISIYALSGLVSVDSAQTFEAEMQGESLVYSINGTSTTIEGLIDGFVISPNGKYITASPSDTSPVYVNDKSQISFGIHGNDTYVAYFNGELVTSNVEVNLDMSAVDGFVDLYALYSSDVSIDFGDSTQNISRLIVPYEVLAHETEGQRTNMILLGVIPLVLFIVPVMMAVRMISGRRD